MNSPVTETELLDRLATDFVQSGWDVRKMQKLIVMSATYRQSSVLPAELAAKDPENRLLARGPRLRLQAEFLCGFVFHDAVHCGPRSWPGKRQFGAPRGLDNFPRLVQC